MPPIFPYTLRQNPRAKHLSIRISGEGLVTVTKPTRVSLETVNFFVTKKAEWIISKIQYVKSLPTPISKITKKDYKLYKIQALVVVEESIKYYNQFYNFTFNKISIKNQKTRWGSCSKKGNLNFSYKLALLPKKLADYIVVHELCHLGEFNHSQKFWDLVAKTVPEYKQNREELKNIRFG